MCQHSIQIILMLRDRLVRLLVARPYRKNGTFFIPEDSTPDPPQIKPFDAVVFKQESKHKVTNSPPHKRFFSVLYQVGCRSHRLCDSP